MLDSISLCTLFQQIHYRQQMQSSFALALVSVFQGKLVNGKSYTEIKEFNATLPTRRKQKFHLSKIRGRLQIISQNCDTVTSSRVTQSHVLEPGSSNYFGIKEAKLSHTMAHYLSESNIKEAVKIFFSQYLAKEANMELLRAFNTFLSNLKPNYELQIKQLDVEKIEWTNSESCKAYLDKLSVWNDEEEKLRKESSKPQMRAKTQLESAFGSFLNAVTTEKEYWGEIVKPINKLISKNEEYNVRFGPLPGASVMGNIFSHESEANIQQAKHVIKIYFLARSILEFNRSLFVYNAMMLEEQGRASLNRNLKIDDDRFDTFLDWCAQSNIKTESDECQVYMTTNGLNCASFRLLISRQLDVKLCSYRQVSFQTLILIETQNLTAKRTESIWLKKDGEQPVGIAPDIGFRELVAAHKEIVRNNRADLDSMMESLFKMNFKEKENVLKFASFFMPAMQKTAIEWIESYVVDARDHSLIQLLYGLMWVDGCHITLFELQTILTMFISLKEIYHCDLDYLLLLANSANQAELVNVFLYARLEYQLGRRITTGPNIFTGIQAIQSIRYKSLFSVKLRDYSGPPIIEEDIYKIVLMLQNASNGAEQLEKMDLNEWMEIAHKQKWSEIGSLLNQYGSIGYYLGILDERGFKEEEERMRALFDQSTLIPEKLIALCTQWIVSKEVDVHKIFEFLKEVLERANEYPNLVDSEAKHQLLTNEKDQAELLEWLLNGNFYKIMCQECDRSVEDLAEKITGLHDSDQEAIERRAYVRRVADLLKVSDTDNEKSKNIYWLTKFDSVLVKLKGKRLRATQKMAVLCAVEGGNRVLEQVNTGEGKSFIIAAIATIHLKTGKSFVDVITSSPVLAQRDMEEMRQLYEELGLTVAHNCSENMEDRKKVGNYSY